MAYGDKKLINIVFPDKRGHEIWELINYYRVLSRMTWFDFILESIKGYIMLDNEAIAKAIQAYIDYRHRMVKMGRPIGSSVSDEIKKAHSVRMKQYWIDKRNAEATTIKEEQQ